MFDQNGKPYSGNGNLPFATTFKKNSATPLDERVAVLYKNNLIDNSVWQVSNSETRYTGMVVFVLRDDYTKPEYQNITDGEHTYDNWPNIPLYPSLIPLLPTGAHLYVLVDENPENWNNYSAWELVGSGSGGGANDTAGNTEVEFTEVEQVKKLFLVGAKSKGQQAGSYAITYVGKQRTINDNDDNNGDYVGDTYVDEHGWLHTADEPVAVKKDLVPIMEALQSMETWPEITTMEGVCRQSQVFNITTSDIPTGEYLVEDMNSNQHDLVNNGVYDVGDAITVKNHIQIDPEANFSCRSELEASAEFIFENAILGMTYGYKDSLDGTKHTGPQNTSLVETLSLRPSSIGTQDKSNLKDTIFALYFNEGQSPIIEVDCDTVRPAGIDSPILAIAAGTSVGRIREGANYIDLKFTNPSEMSVVGNTGIVPGISAFYLSNIGNANNNHHTVIQNQSVSIPDQSNIFATGSNGGVKTSRQCTVYGVQRIYSNGSVLSDNLPTDPNDRQHEFAPDNMSTNAYTNSPNSHNLSYLWNYYTDNEKVIYIKFGSIDSANRDARIFIPIIPNLSLNISSIGEYNSQTGAFDNTEGVYLKLSSTHTIINNIEYAVYEVLSKPARFEGPNAYKIILSR